MGRWDILRANDVYRRTRRTAALQEGCQFPADDKGKEISPLATFNVQQTGGLAARPGSCCRIGGRTKTDEDMGYDVRVLLSTYGGRGDEPLAGLAVRLRALGAEVRVCAPPDRPERSAHSSEGRQREMRTCPTRGSKEPEASLIRSASAVQRSTAASEVSR